MNWATVRRAVLERDNETCVYCLGSATDVHHRTRRGMGGSGSDDLKYGMHNLVSLCSRDHHYFHEHPGMAYASGYMVHTWDDPEEVPLDLGDVKLLLKRDGTIETIGACGTIF